MLYVYLFSKVWYFEWGACETLEISAVRVLHETNHSSTRIFPWFYRNLILLLFSLWYIRIAHFILWEQDWNMQKSRIPNSTLNFSTLDMYMYLFYYVVTQSTDDMLQLASSSNAICWHIFRGYLVIIGKINAWLVPLMNWIWYGNKLWRHKETSLLRYRIEMKPDFISYDGKIKWTSTMVLDEFNTFNVPSKCGLTTRFYKWTCERVLLSWTVWIRRYWWTNTS